jgi:DNA-binding transcriptional ArsR family regulator
VYNLNDALIALSDPTRRAILDRLARGPATINVIAEPFQLTQQAVSKHIAYLERAKLIEKRREGRQQLCMLTPEPLQKVVTWAESCQRVWAARFARLDGVLESMKKEKQRGKKRI